MATWKVTPSDGVTGSNGTYTFPANNSTTEEKSYTISYTSDTNCTASMTYTIPKKEVTPSQNCNNNPPYNLTGTFHTQGEMTNITLVIFTIYIDQNPHFYDFPAGGSLGDCSGAVGSGLHITFRINGVGVGIGENGNGVDINRETIINATPNSVLYQQEVVPPFGTTILNDATCTINASFNGSGPFLPVNIKFEKRT